MPFWSHTCVERPLGLCWMSSKLVLKGASRPQTWLQNNPQDLLKWSQSPVLVLALATFSRTEKDPPPKKTIYPPASALAGASGCGFGELILAIGFVYIADPSVQCLLSSLFDTLLILLFSVCYKMFAMQSLLIAA